MQRIHILGAGRAGRSLAMTLASFGQNNIHLLKKGDALETVTEADLLFVATPDSTLTTVAKQLALQQSLPPIVAYLSGANTLDTFSAIACKAAVAQFHPMAALDGKSMIPAGTLVGICSAEQKTKSLLFELAASMRLRPAGIDDGMQSLYHAAAVVASNLPVALFQDALVLMQKAGLRREEAHHGLAILLQSMAQNLGHLSVEQALTGPIKRGDLGTLETHLKAFANDASLTDIDHRYRTLSLALIDLVSLPAEVKLLAEKVLQ